MPWFMRSRKPIASASSVRSSSFNVKNERNEKAGVLLRSDWSTLKKWWLISSRVPFKPRRAAHQSHTQLMKMSPQGKATDATSKQLESTKDGRCYYPDLSRPSYKLV